MDVLVTDVARVLATAFVRHVTDNFYEWAFPMGDSRVRVRVEVDTPTLLGEYVVKEEAYENG